ncbi:MAG: hypothetical protein FWC97_03030 [Treponema sp.]|nr:hypothetical protein [Treponema sp.]
MNKKFKLFGITVLTLKHRRFKGVFALALLLSFVSIMALTGCVEDIDTPSPDPIITNIRVLGNEYNSGIVFNGETGTLNYFIEIEGEHIFPVNLHGQGVQIGRFVGGQVQPNPGISISAETPNVTASGQRFPLVISIDASRENNLLPDGFSYGTIVLAISVRGRTAAFEAQIDNTSISSVTVVPHPTDPGTVFGGTPGTLNYRITAVGSGLPVSFTGEHVRFQVRTPEGGFTDLPPGISVNPGNIVASSIVAPLSFSVDRPAGATYELRALVRQRPSNSFYIIVQPSSLTGDVAISGTPAVVGQRLEAVTDGLIGEGAFDFQWQRGTGLTFEDITGANNNYYVVQQADIDNQIRVIVGREGFTGSVPSSATNVVSNPGDTPLAGTLTTNTAAQAGQTLTVAVSGLSSGATANFQWQRRHESSLNFVDISGATGNTYDVLDDDADFSIRVIAVSPGFSGYIASAPTDIVPARLVGQLIARLHEMNVLPNEFSITAVVANEQIAPQMLYFGGRNTEITITGESNNILTLNGTGPMFTVGRGVILILENIELRGIHNNTSALVLVDGGMLIMREDSRITANTNVALSPNLFGGGVAVTNRGDFLLEGGTISGNRAQEGGGVFVHGDSEFNMQKGTITNNTAVAEGGGVSIDNAVLFMRDGEISSNDALRGGGVAAHHGGRFGLEYGTITGNTARQGGGVFIGLASLFVMDDGEISGNTASGGVGANTSTGGGVFLLSPNSNPSINRARFTMWDGIITGNSSLNGGGITVDQGGLFVMVDGEIYDNSAIGAAGSSGGGVFIGGATNNIGMFNMEGGRIKNNTAVNTGGGIRNHNGQMAIFDGEISGNHATGDPNATPNPTPGLGGGIFNSAGGIWMFGGNLSENEAMQGGGIENRATFWIETGIIHGSNHPSNANIGTDRGDVLVTQGGLSARGRFTPEGSLIDGTGFIIHSSNVVGILDFTLHMEDGEFVIPITATGMNLTGIPPQYIGKEGRLLLRGLTLDQIADTIITADSAFTWPDWNIPVGNRNMRIQFWDVSGSEDVLYATYRTIAPINLGIGVTDIAFSSFEELPANLVGSINITGISGLTPNCETALLAFTGSDPENEEHWTLIGIIGRSVASPVVIPVIDMEDGVWDIRATSFHWQTDVISGIRSWTGTLTEGANTVPWSEFVLETRSLSRFGNNVNSARILELGRSESGMYSEKLTPANRLIHTEMLTLPETAISFERLFHNVPFNSGMRGQQPVILMPQLEVKQ